MKTLHTLSLISFAILMGCSQDPLEKIKKTKIPDSDKTWGQVAEKFEYCEDGTKKWEIIDEGRQDRIFATFSCTLKPEIYASFNERIKEEADKRKQIEQGIIDDANNKREYLIERYKQEIERKRTRIQEIYKNYCERNPCQYKDEILDNDMLEKHALETTKVEDFFENEFMKRLHGEGLFHNSQIMTYDINSLGKSIRQLQEEEAKPIKTLEKDDFYIPVISIEYKMKLNHWLDEERVKYQGEFESSEELNLTYAGIPPASLNNKKRYPYPYGATHLIENKNPNSILLNY